jgi:hypothetical protein
MLVFELDQSKIRFSGLARINFEIFIFQQKRC